MDEKIRLTMTPSGVDRIAAHTGETPAEVEAAAQRQGFTVEHDPRVTVWANGFGVWHVRVPRNAAGPLLAARRALRDELSQRANRSQQGSSLAREVWLYAVELPELSDAETIVYREWLRDTDPLPAWATETQEEL